MLILFYILWYISGVIPFFVVIHKRRDISLIDLFLILTVGGIFGPIAFILWLSSLDKFIIPRAKQKDNKNSTPSVY